MGAARSSKTLVPYHITSHCYNPEDHNLSVLYNIMHSFYSQIFSVGDFIS